MPGPTLPNMSLILPAVDGDSGIWDSELNTALTLVDSHDHTPGKGLLIKTAAIDIDADLDVGGFAVENVGKVELVEIAALGAGAQIIYVDVADHELYFRAFDGTNIKITSGDTLNMSLVGGIVGDYTAVGAEVAYDDANDRYTFKQQGAPKPWARIASGEVRIYETGTVENVYVGLATPGALAASFTVTLPLALPAGASLLQLDNAGIMTASNIVTAPVTLSGGIHGATSFDTSLDVPTETVATITASVNYKHSYTKFRLVPASAAQPSPGGIVATGTGNAWDLGVTAAVRLVYPVPVEFGDRIIGWSLGVNNTSVAGTVTARLYKTAASGVGIVETALGTAATTSAFGGFVTLGNTGLTVDCNDVTFEQYYVVVTGGGSAGDLIYNLTVKVTRP